MAGWSSMEETRMFAADRDKWRTSVKVLHACAIHLIPKWQPVCYSFVCKHDNLFSLPPQQVQNTNKEF